VAFQEDGAGHEDFSRESTIPESFLWQITLRLKSRDAPFMALPVFPNRKFRHSYIFVPGKFSAERAGSI